MSKFVLHGKYIDFNNNIVFLNDAIGSECFVHVQGKLVKMSINNFLARFRLCV